MRDVEGCASGDFAMSSQTICTTLQEESMAAARWSLKQHIAAICRTVGHPECLCRRACPIASILYVPCLWLSRQNMRPPAAQSNRGDHSRGDGQAVHALQEGRRWISFQATQRSRGSFLLQEDVEVWQQRKATEKIEPDAMATSCSAHYLK